MAEKKLLLRAQTRQRDIRYLLGRKESAYLREAQESPGWRADPGVAVHLDNDKQRLSGIFSGDPKEFGQEYRGGTLPARTCL
jgi:hypothetical protein